MVNFMVEIYEKLDRKNADKVYSILSKESVDCFNIQLHPISPQLSPSTSVETSVSQVNISKAQNKSKKPNTQGLLNNQVHPPRQPPIAQKVSAPHSRKSQNRSKKMNSGLLINMTMSFVVMLGHVFLSGLLINMTMSFVVMLGHVFLSGLLINMTMSFVVMLGHVFLSGLLINMTMSFVVMLGHVFFQDY